MTLFQILMIGMAAFFSYKVYQHIQTLQDEPSQTTPSFDPQKMEEEADRAFTDGDLRRAFMLLDEVNIKGEKNSEILSKMGYILAQEERVNEALSYYQEALSIDKYNDTIHNALASLYRKQGEFAKAEEHYKQSLQIDPSYELTYFNYGNLLVDMNLWGEASKMYEKALKLNPDFKEAKIEMDKIKDKA